MEEVKNIQSGTENGASREGTSVDISQIKKELQEEFRREIDKKYNRNIEVLAIFVALFTFISIDFQIFKQPISIIAAMGVSLITLGALSFFVLLLGFMTENNNFYKKLFALVIIFMVLGISLIGWDYKVKNSPPDRFDIFWNSRSYK